MMRIKPLCPNCQSYDSNNHTCKREWKSEGGGSGGWREVKRVNGTVRDSTYYWATKPLMEKKE